MLQVKNRATSTLASGIDNAVTSLTVASGEGVKFPSTFPFHITIDNEILRCTARTTDTLTVIRAQEGTTAAAHNAAAVVSLNITAGVITSLEDDLTTHAGLTTAHSAVATATASRIVVRDASARAKFAAPAATGDALIKGTRVTADELLDGTSGLYLRAGGAGVNPAYAAISGLPTIVRKTADETVNNSITLQADDHLLMAVGANEIWLVNVFLLIVSNATADFKCGWAYPTGCDIKWKNRGDWGVIAEATDMQEETESLVKSILDTGSHCFEMLAMVANGATAGNINLTWAQNTATVVDTKVLTNSCIIAHKLA